MPGKSSRICAGKSEIKRAREKEGGRVRETQDTPASCFVRFLLAGCVEPSSNFLSCASMTAESDSLS